MSWKWKVTHARKNGVGEFAMYERRSPFNIFLGASTRYGFRPDLTGAAWYEILPPADPVELLGVSDAFSAMAYLRKCDPDLKPVGLR